MSMSATNEWAQLYTSDPTGPGLAQSPPSPVHNIGGRVGKSARKRTRASRRAPTTLLNTDPTNFRAMVQQFTGAPTGPYTAPNGPVMNFGYGDQMLQQQQQQQMAAPAVMMGQYQGQRVSLPGGSGPNGNEGFLQGFNSNSGGGGGGGVEGGNANTGFFMEGMNMMMGSGGNYNERVNAKVNANGGYFL